MTNEAYIALIREEDLRKLAFKKTPEGVDVAWCLQQIEGWQLARKKLPQWAATDGLWYPPRISMEQCSSEPTALYKRSLAERLIPEGERVGMVDLTGGFGMDFSYMSQIFQQAEYVERQTHLCEIVKHNMALFSGNPQSDEAVLGASEGKPVITITNSTTEDYLSRHLSVSNCREEFKEHATHSLLCYLDPARRDNLGRKVVALEDCTPNIVVLQDDLLRLARCVVVKLSPMLDITQALRQLRDVCEVHVVSVQGECKEVLLVMERQPSVDGKDIRQPLTFYCVDIRNDRTDSFHVNNDQTEKPHVVTAPVERLGAEGTILFEPNASVLKAGVQDALCDRFGVEKLHPVSNLFVGQSPLADFPGRQFEIEAVGDFSKGGIKAVTQGLTKANLTIRNFPSTVAELRKRLKLKEGGDTYLFATTLNDGKHVLIRTRKVNQ